MSLSITRDKLLRATGRHLGYSRNPDDWTPDQLQDVSDAVESGLRMFYFGAVTPEGQPYTWSFLRPAATVSLISGTATYEMPVDFQGDLPDGFHFPAGTAKPRIQEVPEETMLGLRNTAASGDPKYCSIRVKAQVDGGSSVYEVTFYPTPSANGTLVYRYPIEPDSLDATNTKPLGGGLHSETIMAACLAAAEQQLNPEEGAGLWSGKFQDALNRSMALDAKALASEGQWAWPIGVDATSLNITRGYLKRLIAREMGFGPNPANWSHHQSQVVDLLVQTGMRRFYAPDVLPGERYPYDWKYLSPTIEIKLTVGNRVISLRDDLQAITGRITYVDPEANFYAELLLRPPGQVERLWDYDDQIGTPIVAALRPRTQSVTPPTIQKPIRGYELILHPTPDVDYTVRFAAKLNPELLDDDADLPLGDLDNAQALIEACLMAAEEEKGVRGGIHAENYVRCMLSAVGADRMRHSPPNLGLNRDLSDSLYREDGLYPWPFPHTITYNGVPIIP